MHLERVLIVVEQRITPDLSYPGFDIRHMEGPLRCTGMVDNIDIFYYGDYVANCDEALISCCLQKKPQAVLMSLQNIAGRGGGPTPKGVWKVTNQLNIPTAAFWFDIHDDGVAKLLENYFDSVKLNVILSADASSHKHLTPDPTNHVYGAPTFDERLFDIPDSVRDMPVAFLGSIYAHRRPWITKLREMGVSVHTNNGYELLYEEYLKLMTRLKIALNFSLLGAANFDPIVLSDRGRVSEVIYRGVRTFKSGLLLVTKNPAKLRDAIPSFKHAAKVIVTKPRYMARARVWEALWCRTFLLEEDNPVTSLYFEPYVDYVPFTTLKDLVDKIRYYLEREEERDRIRLQGRATVDKYYNAKVYWENVFESIGISSGGENHHRPGEIWDKAYFDNWYLKHASGA
ncbi:MAG: glycosyltransferase family 1 protein [Chloroflexi bacterium]|nr:glycosyltransferase family 1 protein [Chloroflexota bacterium]